MTRSCQGNKLLKIAAYILCELEEQAWLKDLQGDSFRLSTPHSAMKMYRYF
jgi:hypothetical protein